MTDLKPLLAGQREALMTGRWRDVSRLLGVIREAATCQPEPVSASEIAQAWQLAGLAEWELGARDRATRAFQQALALGAPAQLDAELLLDLRSEAGAAQQAAIAALDAAEPTWLRVCQASVVDGVAVAPDEVLELHAGAHLVQGPDGAARAGEWLSLPSGARLNLGDCGSRARKQPYMPAPPLLSLLEEPLASEERDVQTRIADAAREFLGASELWVDGKPYRFDCSGLVEAVFAAAGLPFRGSARQLYDQAAALGVVHLRRIPAPGDLAFFDATHRPREEGPLSDDLTHVGVVVDVDAATGTITLVHRGSRGVTTTRMNLRYPSSARTPDGQPANDVLTAQNFANPTGALTGQRWARFASFWQATSSR